MATRRRRTSISPLFKRFMKRAGRKLSEGIARSFGRMAGPRPTTPPPRRERVGRTPTPPARRKGNLEEMLENFGDIKNVVMAMLRPRGRQEGTDAEEMSGAQDILNILKRERRQRRRRREMRESLRTPSETLEEVRRPGRDVEVPDVPEQTEPARRWRSRAEQDPNHPINTGEMIPVNSSNVHSIGYIMNHQSPNRGIIKVRFLFVNPDGGTKPGHLYYYYNIPPHIFRQFIIGAQTSPGTWVWTNLRIRGTVSGHQYPYALKGFVNDYVPRKATRIGDEEHFKRRVNVRGRHSRTGNVGTFSSSLPNRYVGRYNPSPNRGRPRNGQPRNGR